MAETLKKLEKTAKRWVACELEIQQAASRREEELAEVERQYAKDAKKLWEQRKLYEDEIQACLMEERAAVLGTQKSARVGSVRVGFKKGKPVLLDSKTQCSPKNDAVLEVIDENLESATGNLRMHLMSGVNVTRKADLTAVKKLPETILQALGLEVFQEEQEFFIKIAN